MAVSPIKNHLRLAGNALKRNPIHYAGGCLLYFKMCLYQKNKGSLSFKGAKTKNYSIVAPNGIRASPANLKHCSPTGIPTIVMHHKTPTKKEAAAR